ncbi:MAG TPA: tripartite tricarboxylate transporter substrate binding protein [Xanthobacteraceae bacterium]|jgi:tripartite-type tricarboxylate transporter receptor subunit TctC
MKLSRRELLQVGAGFAVASAFPRLASALDYPARAVRLIAGFAAGGAADVCARLLGQQLSARLGQQFIVENRTGAGGIIATEEVARAAPDGHTLLVCAFANAVNTSLSPRPNFNFLRDIAPVAGTVRLPLILLVNPTVPATSLPELIAYAKANPGKLDFPSAGIGSSEHMAGELFKLMAGVDMVHVPFRGGAPAIAALIAGQAQAYFCAMPTSLSGIKAGMRALAITTATRSNALPELPTISELLPGYDVSLWFGIGAPKDTPSEINEKLNKAVNASLATADFAKRVADLGGVPMPMTPAAFGKLMADETEKWGNVIRAADLKAG